jgi:hypothetical protein
MLLAVRRLTLTFVAVLLPCIVSAQDRRWEIEGYAGALVGQPMSAGTVTLPAPGPPIVTSTPTFPSRAVPSWLFGDGAALLNGVLQDFGLAHRVEPLDSLLAPVPVSHPAASGLRVRRRLNRRVALEVSVDGYWGSTIPTERISRALDSSFSSLGPAFTELFSSGPFSPSKVTTAGGVMHAPYDEGSVTVAVNHDVGRLGAWQPYATLGAGIAFPSEAVFAAGSVQARYTTSILGEAPIDETDRVDVSFARPKSVVAVLGGGVRRDLSARWAIRFDARWLIGPDTTRVTIDAQPTVARGTPAGFIESFTNPAIQFSNDPSTGRVSSLSGAPLHGVEVFHGGVIARTLVSAAIALRF